MEFEKVKPKIFTGLLNAMASGLTHINDVNLDQKPRMYDAALWITACEYGLNSEHSFINVHSKNQDEVSAMGIEASPIGSAIMELMENKKSWMGTPTELFSMLESIANERQIRSRAWPVSTKGLSNIINRLTPSFRKLGIEIYRDRKNK